jgi:hypothetical protein
MKLKTKILTARWGDGALREAWVFAGFLNNLSRFERLAVRKCFFGLIIRVGLLEVVCLFVHKEINSWCFFAFFDHFSLFYCPIIKNQADSTKLFDSSSNFEG